MQRINPCDVMKNDWVDTLEWVIRQDLTEQMNLSWDLKKGAMHAEINRKTFQSFESSRHRKKSNVAAT